MAISTPHSRQVAVLMGFVLVLVGAITSERRVWGGSRLASPIVIYVVVAMLSFGLLPLGSLNEVRTDARFAMSPSALLDSSVLALVGVTITTIVAAGVSRMRRQQARRSSPRESPAVRGPVPRWLVIWAALVVLLGSRLYQISSLRYGYVGRLEAHGSLLETLLSVLDHAVPLVFALLVYISQASGVRSTSGRRALVTIAVSLPILLLTAVASGFTNRLLSDLLPAGIVFFAQRRRVPWLATAAVVLYTSQVFAGVESFRDAIRSGELSAEDMDSPLAPAIEISKRARDEGLTDPMRSVNELFEQATTEYRVLNENLALILLQTGSESAPHLGNARLVADAVFFVPRNTLTEQVNTGTYVNAVYRDGSTASSSPPTISGDLWISGGSATFVVGHALFGVLLGSIGRLTVLRDRRFLPLYGLLVSVVIVSGGEVGQSVRIALQFIVIYPPMILLMLGRPRPRRRTLEAPQAPDARAMPHDLERGEQ